jgi:hypothetical protein
MRCRKLEVSRAEAVIVEKRRLAKKLRPSPQIDVAHTFVH